jgi:hypothetical protein
MSDITELIIQNDDPINVKELNSFLTQLEGLYFFFKTHPEILEKINTSKYPQEELNFERLEPEIQDAFINSKYSSKDLIYHFNLRRKKSDLEIVYLSKKSPLVIIFGTVVLALTAAIILSGGKADVEFLGAKIKFQIPALAEGLMKLEEFKQRVRYNRQERRNLPEVINQEMISDTKRDLRSEIQLLEKAKKVEDIDSETIQKLSKEIKKKKDELDNLNQQKI